MAFLDCSWFFIGVLVFICFLEIFNLVPLLTYPSYEFFVRLGFQWPDGSSRHSFPVFRTLHDPFLRNFLEIPSNFLDNSRKFADMSMKFLESSRTFGGNSRNVLELSRIWKTIVCSLKLFGVPNGSKLSGRIVGTVST